MPQADDGDVPGDGSGEKRRRPRKSRWGRQIHQNHRLSGRLRDFPADCAPHREPELLQGTYVRIKLRDCKPQPPFILLKIFRSHSRDVEHTVSAHFSVYNFRNLIGNINKETIVWNKIFFLTTNVIFQHDFCIPLWLVIIP